MGRGISHKICAGLFGGERREILALPLAPINRKTNRSGEQTNNKQTTLAMMISLRANKQS